MELTELQRTSILETIDAMQSNKANMAYTTFSNLNLNSFAIVSRDYLAMLQDCQQELEEIRARPEMVNYQRFPDD